MRPNRDSINQRCAKLEAQGLEIYHEDSSVCCYVGTDEVILDFSANPEERWLMSAIQQAYRLGLEKGRKDFQSSLRKLLGVEE